VGDIINAYNILVGNPEGKKLHGRHTHTVLSPAEKPWVECGAVGDAIPCDRGRYKLVKRFCYYPFWKNYLPHNSFIWQAVVPVMTCL
jgi:hypothetical protein